MDDLTYAIILVRASRVEQMIRIMELIRCEPSLALPFAAAKSTPIKDKEMAQTYEQLGGDGKIQQLIDSKRLRPTDQVRLAAERIAMFNEPEEFESLIKEYIGPNVEKRA